MNKKVFIVILAGSLSLFSATHKTGFSYKTHGNVANYFASEKEFAGFFNFQKGDVVAEIGAGTGKNLCGFAQITDSVTFYLEDIDSTLLSQGRFNQLTKRCKKLKKINAHTFYRIIGTETATLLPDSLFDKVILVSTFHEFTSMDEMMKDIYKKLKPGGKLYILESHCLAHKNYTADETVAMMKKYNFQLEQKDGKDMNGSTGLYRTIFKK